MVAAVSPCRHVSVSPRRQVHVGKRRKDKKSALISEVLLEWSHQLTLCCHINLVCSLFKQQQTTAVYYHSATLMKLHYVQNTPH